MSLLPVDTFGVRDWEVGNKDYGYRFRCSGLREHIYCSALGPTPISAVLVKFSIVARNTLGTFLR